MICDRCHAGQMLEYEKRIGADDRATILKGSRCERCGFTELSNDDGIWSTIGL